MGISSLEQDIIEGENPVCDLSVISSRVDLLMSRVVWDCSLKLGGRSHPKLNISGRPIEKKYSDGKVKRTLKRRSKVLEIVKRETNGTSILKVEDSVYRPFY